MRKAHYIVLNVNNIVFIPGKFKPAKVEDVLNLLAAGYLKGGLGFLKSSSAGEMIKGSPNVSREVRVGITHVSILGLQRCSFHLSLPRCSFYLSLPRC